jgi:hypothetical protein
MLCEQPLEPCNRTAVTEYRKRHNRNFTTVVALCAVCSGVDGASLVHSGYQLQEV